MINIVFEDEYILVCEKPAGISCEKSSNGGDLVSLLCENTDKELFTVHRLDNPTSGLTVLAKNQMSASALSNQIQNGSFKKEYIALIHGLPDQNDGIFEDLLFFDKAKNKSYTVKRERKGVKKAKLSYSVTATESCLDYNISRVRIKLFTGRTHQIRVQFASRKMPVLGDGKYGAADNISPLRLYSAKLEFLHPKTHKALVFTSEPNW